MWYKRCINHCNELSQYLFCWITILAFITFVYRYTFYSRLSLNNKFERVMVCPFRMQISNAFGGWYLPWECTLAVKELCLFICSLACVASVSVRFRTKKPGTRVKDGAKNGVSKSGERVGKKGRKRLQTNPGILKTAHLACHAWVRAPTFDAVISCHNWPIKCLAFSGAEMNFRGRVCEPKIYFFVFVFFVTRGRRLCWNINESQRSIQALDICLFQSV